MDLKPKAAIFKKLRYRLLIYLVAALILIMPLRPALEHHFLYFPDPHRVATPATVGLSYEEVDFQATDDTQLNGWLVPGQSGSPIVLFCMGNAGNISHRLETIQLLHDLGVAVFIINYRGYGLSEGKTSETGTYHDVAGAMEFLNKRGWPAERTIIFGRSLGAAIGLEAAMNNPPAGLIMESAFTSVAAMGRHHYPLLNLLLGWLINAKYNNLEKIAELDCPLLLIHGKSDSICPPRMAEELYARVSGEKQLLWIPGADHNNGFLVGGESYRQALRQAIALWTGFTISVD
ncbi:MAG: alpha/beta fold hydrolase [Desulfuromonadales bacterium]|nr:alpha/beta fold hydrolase [Desulfuromonadales bacterium]